MLRYMKRPAVALARIAYEPGEDSVLYTAPFNPMLGTDRIQVDPIEFIAKVLMHLPDRNSRRVMGYGVYSNRGLGERRKAGRRAEDGGSAPNVLTYEPETEADAFAKRRRQSWARLIQKVFEVSPLACPRCRGEMKVVSIITDTAVIDQILRHLRNRSRAPPEEHAA